MSSAAGALGTGRTALGVGTAASVVLHAAFFAFLARLPSTTFQREEVAVDVVEAPPPAPAPAPVAEPAKPAPPPEPVAVARPRPRPVPRDAPPPPAPVPDDAPPPPNETPPPGAARKAPVRIGVSMSSTTTAGGVAAPVGNTLYGELPKTAPAPEDVKPYAADRYAPPTQVSTLPKGGCEIPEAEYPRDALERGQAGAVALQLLVGTDGKVREVKVVRDPLGFGAAAKQSALRHCRFTPAKRGDETVATWIPYTIRYEPR